MIPKAYEDFILQGCPYCHGNFFVNSQNEQIAVSTYTVDTYLCEQCSEVFEIHKNDDVEESFLFSCNGIYVRYVFMLNCFFITKNANLLFSKLGLVISTSEIPAFIIDFSDKEKLYNKLRTYLLFS